MRSTVRLHAPGARSSVSADLDPAVLREHAYLVARGVRSLALAGHAESAAITSLAIASTLEQVAEPRTIPFVIDRGDGFVDFGFASKRWVIELYRWAVTEKENAVPDVHRHRILGLLLGYSADAIDAFEEERSGRLFYEVPLTSV